MDQAKEEQGQSLVDLGTASHHLMDREAVTRMSGSAPDEPSLANEGHIWYTKGQPVHPQPDDS